MLTATFDRDAHVAVVTLDRPEARNAIDAETALAIERAFDQIEADPSIWVTVLTGSMPVFCAGADLREIQAGREASLHTDRGGFAGFVRRARTKPVIAAVEGAALAGGMEITLACDMIVAAESAKFGLPEVKRSLVAAAGGLFRLPRKVPAAVAMEMITTGDPIYAPRAHAIGLVNTVTATGDAIAGALELAARITANAAQAVYISAAVVSRASELSADEAWVASRIAMETAMQTEDFEEGLSAFLEKRTPKWTGR